MSSSPISIVASSATLIAGPANITPTINVAITSPVRMNIRLTYGTDFGTTPTGGFNLRAGVGGNTDIGTFSGGGTRFSSNVLTRETTPTVQSAALNAMIHELTHSTPRASVTTNSRRVVEWEVDWTPPTHTQGNGELSLNTWAMATNANGAFTGDSMAVSHASTLLYNPRPTLNITRQSGVTAQGAGVPLTFSIAGTDANNDTLTYTVSRAMSGTVTLAGTTATYAPASGFVGSDFFEYWVSDGTSVSEKGSAIILVTDIPVGVIGSIDRTDNGCTVAINGSPYLPGLILLPIIIGLLRRYFRTHHHR